MFSFVRTIFWIVFITLASVQFHFAQQDSANEHFRRGKEYFHAETVSDSTLLAAQHEFEQVLMHNPGFAAARAYLGLIALEKHDTTTAQQQFEKALALDSTCAEVHIGLARLFRVQGKANEQYAELQTAIRLAPENVFARRELVSALLHGENESFLDEERLNEAIPHLQVILRFDSSDSEAHFDLAQVFEYFQKWDSALVHYDAAMSYRKTPVTDYGSPNDLQFNIARCLENLGRFKEALSVYQSYLAELEKNGADEQTLWVVRKSIQKLQYRVKQ